MGSLAIILFIFFILPFVCIFILYTLVYLFVFCYTVERCFSQVGHLASPATDFFSLGVIAYMLVSGGRLDFLFLFHVLSVYTFTLLSFICYLQ